MAVLASRQFYEIQNRLLDLPTMRAHINYTTPLAFSVAAGASKVLGLDMEHTANAMAIAGVGVVSCAVIQAEPVSNWKGLSSGEAASRALHNTYGPALQVREGYSTGPTEFSRLFATALTPIGRRSGSPMRGAHQ